MQSFDISAEVYLVCDKQKVPPITFQDCFSSGQWASLLSIVFICFNPDGFVKSNQTSQLTCSVFAKESFRRENQDFIFPNCERRCRESSKHQIFMSYFYINQNITPIKAVQGYWLLHFNPTKQGRSIFFFSCFQRVENSQKQRKHTWHTGAWHIQQGKQLPEFLNKYFPLNTLFNQYKWQLGGRWVCRHTPKIRYG